VGETPEMLSKVENNDVAAVRWAVQLFPDLMLLDKCEETGQE
jgi:hypothetical protein